MSSKNNFWTFFAKTTDNKLKLKKRNKPIYALAPMAGITDSAFRQMCKKFGADVLYSEMASATALNYQPKKTLELIEFDEVERPYVVQLFGNEPEHFAVAARLVSRLTETRSGHLTRTCSDRSARIEARSDRSAQTGTRSDRSAQTGTRSDRSASVSSSYSKQSKYLRDSLSISRGSVPTARSVPTAIGIDINFGCPVPKIVKQGCGTALFSDLKRSREVIKAVLDSCDLPVSIKTRSRVGDIDVLKFLDYMKDLDISALMIHGRTPAQGFSGPVDTGIIRKARNYFGGVILANGGVGMDVGGFHGPAGQALTPAPSPPARPGERGDCSKNYVEWLLNETGADGVGIAQGAMGRPWIFKAVRTGQSLTRSKRAVFKEALTHAKLAEKMKGAHGIIEMRKHLCWYVAGLPGAREMRRDLVRVETIKDIQAIFKETS